jgi:hypothetical protein
VLQTAVTTRARQMRRGEGTADVRNQKIKGKKNRKKQTEGRIGI